MALKFEAGPKSRSGVVPRSLWSRGAVWLGVALGLAIDAILFGSVSEFVRSIDRCDALFCDFRNHFHPMAEGLFRLRRPVLGFFYPPFAALLLAPLGALPVSWAYWAWGILQVTATALLVIVPTRMFLPRQPWLQFACGLLVVTSLPVLNNFKWGQVSVALTAMVLTAFWLRDRRHLYAPAALLAAAMSIKIYPALVLIYPLARGDFRLLRMTGIAALFFSVVLPALVLGPGDAWQFFLEMQIAFERLGQLAMHDFNSQYFSHVIARVLAADVYQSVSLRIVALAIAAANLMLVLALVRREARHVGAWALVLCLGSLPFLVTTSWPHYFSYLPVGQVLLMATVVERRQPRTTGWIAAALLSICVGLSSVFVLSVVGDWKRVSRFGALFFANLAMLAAAWVLSVEAIRSRITVPWPDGNPPKADLD